MRAAAGSLRILSTAFALVCVLDFSTQVDGLLKYCSGRLLVSVWGWAALVYLSLGLMVWFGCVIAAGAASRCRPLPFELRLSRLAGVAACFICSLGVTLWLKQWIDVYLPTTLGLPGILALLLIAAVIGVAEMRYYSKNRDQIDRFSKWFSGCVVALAAFGVISGRHAAPDTAKDGMNVPHTGRRPNIVMISVDALAANQMSLYGSMPLNTPSLDALAKEAVVYDRFFANSNFTTCSINSILNGVRPWTHRAFQLNSRPNPRIAEHGMIARLKEAGYMTHAITSNSYATPYTSRNEKYFDSISHVAGFFSTDEIYTRTEPVSYPLALVTTFPNILRLCYFVDRSLSYSGIWPIRDAYNTRGTETACINKLHLVREEGSWFVWVHFFAPHDPYAANDAFIGRFYAGSDARSRFDSTPPAGYAVNYGNRDKDKHLLARYQESILQVDASIGRIIDELKKIGKYDNCLIVVTSDHGESFSHAFASHGGAALHNDLIHVPLIIKLPGMKDGWVDHSLSEQIDIMPTILGVLGISKGDWQGHDLLNDTSLGGRPIYAMNFERNSGFGLIERGSLAMIDGDWKYTHYLKPQTLSYYKNLQDTLFNLRQDPGEVNDLRGAETALAERMRHSIETALSQWNEAR